MTEIVYGRATAGSEHAFVLFRIGARFNGLRGLWHALRLGVAMPTMLAELERDRDLGLISAEYSFAWPVIVLTQFWQSYEQLERYAAARDRAHLPAWRWFNRLGRHGHGVGIFHEAYTITPGTYESMYVNMPAFGLSHAFGLRALRAGEDGSRGRVTAGRSATRTSGAEDFGEHGVDDGRVAQDPRVTEPVDLE